MISRLSLQSMRTSLNLSSRPFANHRLFWIAIAFVFFVSLWLGLWVNSEKSRVIAKADEVAGMVKAQEGKVDEYQKWRAFLTKVDLLMHREVRFVKGGS